VPPFLSQEEEWFATVDHATSMGVEAVIVAQRRRIAPWFGFEMMVYPVGGAYVGQGWDLSELPTMVAGTSLAEVFRAIAEDAADYFGD
jgi:hypothetical protein